MKFLFLNIIYSFLFLLSSSHLLYAETYETLDGVILDFEVSGDGEALVMLHSGMMSRDDMRTQIEYFAEFYKVIALDSREQGRSSAARSQITYEQMAGDVVALLTHLDIEKAHLFGQSDGGITALMVSHLYPNRVIKSVIHGAVYNHSAYSEDQKEGWKNASFDQYDEASRDPSGFPGMAIPHYLKGHSDISDFEAHYKEMAMMWATQPNLSKDDLAKIEVPTLVIVGDHWDISISHTVELHEALPKSELFVAPGATHFIHQEKPDMLHRIMHDYLKE